jgi:hypothetical protein
VVDIFGLPPTGRDEQLKVSPPWWAAGPGL